MRAGIGDNDEAAGFPAGWHFGAARGALPALLLATAVAAGAQEVVAIVNPENAHPIERATLVRIYTGTQRSWPDGSPVVALDQPEESEARAVFCRSILGRSAANIRAIWAQNIFTGKGLPPRVLPGDAEMKKAVAGNRGAVGYIRSPTLDSSVKALPY